MHCIDCSPGPKYHIDAKLTRFGRDGTPAYSIHGRMEGRGKTYDSNSLLIYWSVNPLNVKTIRKELDWVWQFFWILSSSTPKFYFLYLQQEFSALLDQEHTAPRKPLLAAPIANNHPTLWVTAPSIGPSTPCPPQTNTPFLLLWAPTSWPRHPVLVTPSRGKAKLEVLLRTYLKRRVLVDITAQIPTSISQDGLLSLCWADTMQKGSQQLCQVLEVITLRKWQCTSPDLLHSP